MGKRMVQVIGPMGAGKGVVAKHFELLYGYSVFPLSQIIRRKTQEAGLTETRENLQKIAAQLRTDHGSDSIARKTIELARKYINQGVVIDGARNIAEVEYVKQIFPDALLLYVDAPMDIRRERILQRARPGDPTNLALLNQVITRDLHQVLPCKNVAGVRILENNQTREELGQYVEALLRHAIFGIQKCTNRYVPGDTTADEMANFRESRA